MIRIFHRGAWTGVLLGLLACGAEVRVAARLEVSPTALSLSHGEFTALRLAWTPRLAGEELGERPTVFVHLWDGGGRLLRTFDHPLPRGWAIGEVVEDEVVLYQSALAPALAAGEYRVTVGLYNAEDERWGIDVASLSGVEDLEYPVATLSVPRETGESPLRFDDAWLAGEEGGDLQVLTRRWLTRAGGLTLGGLSGPVECRMTLQVPAAGAASNLRLLLDEGEDVPRVRLFSPCSPEDATSSGPGVHEVRLVLSPAVVDGGAGECEIRLEPNFHLLSTETLERKAVALEVLACNRRGP